METSPQGGNQGSGHGLSCSSERERDTLPSHALPGLVLPLPRATSSPSRTKSPSSGPVTPERFSSLPERKCDRTLSLSFPSRPLLLHHLQSDPTSPQPAKAILKNITTNRYNRLCSLVIRSHPSETSERANTSSPLVALTWGHLFSLLSLPSVSHRVHLPCVSNRVQEYIKSR